MQSDIWANAMSTAMEYSESAALSVLEKSADVEWSVCGNDWPYLNEVHVHVVY